MCQIFPIIHWRGWTTWSWLNDSKLWITDCLISPQCSSSMNPGLFVEHNHIKKRKCSYMLFTSVRQAAQEINLFKRLWCTVPTHLLCCSMATSMQNFCCLHVLIYFLKTDILDSDSTFYHLPCLPAYCDNSFEIANHITRNANMKFVTAKFSCFTSRQNIFSSSFQSHDLIEIHYRLLSPKIPDIKGLLIQQ